MSASGIICILGIEVGSVDSKSVNTSVKPELDSRLIDGLSHFLQFPVEIWLLRNEQMQVVLVSFGDIFPGTTAKDSSPVVWRAFLAIDDLGISPDVPFSFRVGLVLFAFFEPGMLIAGVVDDQVEYQLHAELMNFINQFVHILESAEGWIYVFVIGDVITKICLWRIVHGREPYDVDAEIFEIWQGADGSWNITYAVAVAVLVGSRPYLIRCPSLPPVGSWGSHVVGLMM